MIAHVGGLPVEETLLALISGTSAGLLMARHWVATRKRGIRKLVDRPALSFAVRRGPGMPGPLTSPARRRERAPESRHR